MLVKSNIISNIKTFVIGNFVSKHVVIAIVINNSNILLQNKTIALGFAKNIIEIGLLTVRFNNFVTFDKIVAIIRSIAPATARAVSI